MDYTAYLDDEMQAFLARFEALYPEGAASIEQQRQNYMALCAAFDFDRPAGLEIVDEPHGGWPCRRYEPAAPVGTMVYFHGGGFVVGGLDSHDSICAEIAATGLRVVAVDYPLAPEHRFPEDFNAAWQASDAIASRWGPVVLAGDSAGGNLAAAVAHQARGGRLDVAGQLLIYPGLGGEWDWPSYVTHAQAPGLTTADMKFYMEIRAGDHLPVNDPRFAPLCDPDMAGLPPTVCITAECDPLTSDSDVYCQRIRAAGGQALWVDEPGLIHGYLRARGMSARAAASFSRICAAARALAEGRWPVL